MSTEPVAVTPQCVECEKVWLADDADRWRLHRDCDWNLVWYCADCAEREFEY